MTPGMTCTTRLAMTAIGLELIGFEDDALECVAHILDHAHTAGLLETVACWMDLARASAWPDRTITTVRPIVRSIDGFEVPIEATPVELRFVARLVAAYLADDVELIAALWTGSAEITGPSRVTCLTLILRAAANLIGSPRELWGLGWEVVA